MQVSDEYVETNHQVIDWVAGLEGFAMWQRLPAFIREWPILIVGILLIVPLLYSFFP